MPARQPISIRTHLLGIVILGGIIPLALIGFWLTRSAVRSGRQLLDTQLQASLANIRHSVEVKWEDRRGGLLLLANNQVTRDALARGYLTHDDSLFLASGAGMLGDVIGSFGYRDSTGREIYSASRPVALRDTTRRAARGTIHLTYPVGDSIRHLGTLEADLFIDAILPTDSARLLLPGSSLAVHDRTNGAELMRLGGIAPFPASPEVLVNGAPWMVKTAALASPGLDLAVGSPLGPYVTPFERDARIGYVALVAVALVAVLLATFLTIRLARSVDTLVDAAGAVADGDLSGHAALAGPAEFRRLATSFNAMTESLRRLVTELSERRALAAVGEFAAALSHEVRNALTAIQIDLERVDERTEDAKNRVLVSRTLTHVRRLDAAVTGSLRIARSGHVTHERLELGAVLADVVSAVEPSFLAIDAHVALQPSAGPLVVRGDVEALRQLFLNLLLNAQQAIGAGGDVEISVDVVEEKVRIVVVDTGRGMTAEQVGRAFDPYYTTRAKGTGLGLPIARQIAVAHGGSLTIASNPGTGTRVEVRLPEFPGAVEAEARSLKAPPTASAPVHVETN